MDNSPQRKIIAVQTFICKPVGEEDEHESTFYINLYRAEQRQRLAKHCWWAMHNGRAVTTVAKEFE